MKRINKGISPTWFETWKTQFESANGRKPKYKGDFSADDHTDVASWQRRNNLKEALMREQGRICCYCMGRINSNTAHIEHFWPKGVSEFSHLDLDYNNLFASCEGKRVFHAEADLLNVYDEFCGHKKEDWYDENMIIPTDHRIENIFEYLDNGEIRAKKGKSTSYVADLMLKNLGLDSFHLNRNRKEAIDAVYEEIDAAGIEDESEIIDLIDFYNNMSNGEYVPYCGALVDCLERTFLT